METRSPRVSPLEDDQMQRSTKKVKTRREVELHKPPDCMDIMPSDESAIKPTPKGSYKDTLLTGPGLGGYHEEDEPIDIDDDGPNPEDKWYKDNEERENEDKPFDPCPTIPVSKEEFEEWCKPWKSALMVKYGHRAEQCMENPVANGDPVDVAAAEESSTTEGKAATVENQNGKNEFSSNQRDPSTENISTDFGPWMLVKRYSKKKKVPLRQGRSSAVQDHATIYNSEEDNSPRKKDMESGSRFIILHEERQENMHEIVNHEEKAQEEPNQCGPQKPQAQLVNGKTQSVQKKILRPGAGKNPQNQRKSISHPKLGTDPNGKGNRNKIKIPEDSNVNPKGLEASPSSVKGKGKKVEIEDMELVVREYMKRMEKDQWEASEVLKKASANLGNHTIRDNLLFNSGHNQMRTEAPTVVAGTTSSLAKHADTTMGDVMMDGKKEESTSRDQAAIYGNPHKVYRRSLWNSLKEYANNVILPWCLMGDFNAMLHNHEKQGGAINNGQSACKDFQDCVSTCGLVDLGFSGWPFTWKRGNLAERLDRGLSNLDWQIAFPEARIKHLPMLKSDHSPICLQLLSPMDHNRGRRPFRFLASWLTHPDFGNVLWPEVQSNCIWRIGDGAQIRFWDHNWVPGLGRLDRVANQVSSNFNYSNSLMEFLDVSGHWDTGKLQELLPEDVVKKIVAISSPSPWKGTDHLAWGLTPDGLFNTKSAYQSLSEEQHTPNTVFRQVWNWQGPERIRTFLWLVAHNAILTNSERRRRHLTNDDSCPRCHHHDETVIHVLRDCSYAQCIWKYLLPPNFVNSFFNTDLKDWLMQNLTSKNDWPCLFGVAASSIWHFRNKLIFNGQSVPMVTAVSRIKARSEEFLKVTKSNILPRNLQAAGNCYIAWSRPPTDFVKLNVDGSLYAYRNNAACGGVFRDADGRFLKGFSCNLGGCSIMHAELWAIVHGLQIAVVNGYQSIVVESDSAAAIKFINHGCSPTHPCAPLIQDIRIMAARLQHIIWLHSLREANSVADLLAKKGQDMPLGLHLFDRAPSDITYALFCDCYGALRLRGS
ncbi:hypothetical protein Ahy_B10g102615 [Arachis hypogaea]|uniref:Uncharacterized protein n=1 Tax=Arachis hypogaea TaxID=3818 RepID=A0A444X250_ARAHY|nr:hypothetical protein Ahy_B10g102615 [Arachis hypogaea]